MGGKRRSTEGEEVAEVWRLVIRKDKEVE